MLTEDRVRPVEVSLQKRLGFRAGQVETAKKKNPLNYENQTLQCLVWTTWPGLHGNLGSMRGNLSLLVTVETPTPNTVPVMEQTLGTYLLTKRTVGVHKHLLSFLLSYSQELKWTTDLWPFCHLWLVLNGQDCPRAHLPVFHFPSDLPGPPPPSPFHQEQ